MDDLRLQTNRIRHLEWLFDPPGMPLPHRIQGQAQTTSALVRGAAGTGKTTLALALAVGITDWLGGGVYYLSTEIAPVDVRFKLPALGLQPGDVGPLGEGKRITVDHLLLVSESNLEERGARTRAALERVQEVVLRGDGPAPRVVVIDAFSLVGEGGDPTALRLQLAETIQAFDARGVSVVLVEEAPVSGADWASFVVDLVFELGWGEDPDTKARIRQLSLPKSRFATAANGPHDYGMEEGLLAVWPDLGTIRADLVLRDALGDDAPPAFLDRSGSWIEGMVGVDGTASGTAQALTGGVPWERLVKMRLGPKNLVGSSHVPAHLGPHAAVWTALGQARQTGARLWLVDDPEFALSRSRQSVPLFSAFGLIAERATVLVYGEPNGLQRFPIAFRYADGPRPGKPAPAVRHLRDLRGAVGRIQRLLAQVPEEHGFLTRPPLRALLPWALLNALILRESRALDSYLATATPDADLEPLVRHALARNGRMAEAVARIQETDPKIRRLLEAELQLNLYTPEGLAAAEPVYAELLADPRLPKADKTLMTEQLAQVRAALAEG